MSALLANQKAAADPLSTQPQIGVAAEYASNPKLGASNAEQSQSRAALIADFPLNYDLDKLHFAVTPNIRYSGSEGYSSVISNYYHLDSSAQYANDLGSLKLSSAVYEDSSLLYPAGTQNAVGVRRETYSEDVNWLRALTERLQFQTDLSTARTLYGQNAQSTDLVDYRYSALSPGFVYSLSERNTVRLVGSLGRYNSLDDMTSSRSTNVQVGLDRKLTELWSLSLLAGYSKSINQDRFFFGSIEGKQKGAIYSATFTRTTENLTATLGVSRALTPTGFAFLSPQDTINGSFTYNLSESWSFGGTALWSKVSDPEIGGGTLQQRYYDARLSAQWHWSENWSVALVLDKVGQQFVQSGSVTSNNVTIQILRQFNRTDLQ